MSKQKVINTGDISFLVRSYYDIQKVRCEHYNRCAAFDRSQEATVPESEEHFDLAKDKLQAAEDEIKRYLEKATWDHPLRQGFLHGVHGMGPCLSAGVISFIERRKQVWALLEDGSETWVTDPSLFPNEGVLKERYKELGVKELTEKVRRGIACFPNISCLWNFAGVGFDKDGEIQRRKAKVKSNWNPHFKVLAWKIGKQMVRNSPEKSSYRREYDRYKEDQQRQHPEEVKVEYKGSDGKMKTRTSFTKLHIDNRSIRYVGKILLAHVWMWWREHRGLEVHNPWIIEHGHHETLKHWKDYIDNKDKLAA